jgi:hypothetical protein
MSDVMRCPMHGAPLVPLSQKRWEEGPPDPNGYECGCDYGDPQPIHRSETATAGPSREHVAEAIEILARSPALLVDGAIIVTISEHTRAVLVSELQRRPWNAVKPLEHKGRGLDEPDGHSTGVSGSFGG